MDQTLPVGRIAVRDIDLTATKNGAAVSPSVTAPAWAASLNVYAIASSLDGTVTIDITECFGAITGDVFTPGDEIIAAPDAFLPIDPVVQLTKSGTTGAAVKRGIRCTPGARYRGEVSQGASSSDAKAQLVFEFSPNDPV